MIVWFTKMTELLQNGQHRVLARTFRDFTKPRHYTLHRAVDNYRHFKTTWQSHLQGTGLKMEPWSSSKTSITSCRPVSHNVPEEWRCHLRHSRNLQSNNPNVHYCIHIMFCSSDLACVDCVQSTSARWKTKDTVVPVSAMMVYRNVGV